MTKWIKCSERLPDDSRIVLVFSKGQLHFGSYNDWEKVWWIYEGGNCFTAYVTHWMPLPEPPEGE
jgi:hypothetical protein